VLTGETVWTCDRGLVLTCDELRDRFVSDLGVDDSGGHAGVGDPPPCSSPRVNVYCRAAWTPWEGGPCLWEADVGAKTISSLKYKQVLCFITTFYTVNMLMNMLLNKFYVS
jgi:hypothetical protein